MKLILTTSALCAAALAILFGVPGVGLHPRVARAQSGCDATSLNSSYAYTLNGMYYDSQYYVYYYGDIGILTADGNGNLTGSGTVSNDGFVTQNRSITGSYTVNANCMGSAKLQYSDKTSLSMDFVIFNGGKNIHFVDTDSNVVITGTATQQFPPAAAAPAAPAQ